MTTRRITVTLPAGLAEELDRAARNRSRFVAEAIRHELDRLRREELHSSLEEPHPETVQLAKLGMAEWAETAADGDDALVDPSAGKPVRWSEAE
jgi:hypothetical protein